MITLHHCLSARSFRPLWMLEELGVDSELSVLPFPPRVQARSFLEVNPLGTVPALVDGAQHLDLQERFEPTVQRYWQRLQQRDGCQRAMQARFDAATAQGISLIPAPDTR